MNTETFTWKFKAPCYQSGLLLKYFKRFLSINRNFVGWRKRLCYCVSISECTLWKITFYLCFQALPPWFVPRRWDRTATRVESSWSPKTPYLHLTNPNWVRYGHNREVACIRMCLYPSVDHPVCRYKLLINGVVSFQAMNLDSSSILLRSSDFYQQYGIEVWTQKEVRSRGDNLFGMYSHRLWEKPSLSLVFVKNCVLCCRWCR